MTQVFDKKIYIASITGTQREEGNKSNRTKELYRIQAKNGYQQLNHSEERK